MLQKTAKGFRSWLAGATALLLSGQLYPVGVPALDRREVPPTRDQPPFSLTTAAQLFAGSMGFPGLQRKAAGPGKPGGRGEVRIPQPVAGSGSGCGTGPGGQAGAAARERSQARTSPAFRPSGRLRQTSQYA